MNRIDFITKFENGQCDEDEMVEGMQSLIDNRTIVGLQGYYQRLAEQLIADGRCHRPGQCRSCSNDWMC
jgi:hypothetical protein